MTMLSPDLIRPAKLSDVQAPGILLPIDKYGAPFLVVGEANNPDVIFLDKQFKFVSFKRSEGSNYQGLAIENLKFEVAIETALDLAGYWRAPGMAIRKGKFLSILALSDDRLRRTMEIQVATDLPEGTEGQSVAFTKWRAFVLIGERRRVVWENSLVLESTL